MGMPLCAGKLAMFQGICYIVFSVSFPVVSNCIKGLGSELLGSVSRVSHWYGPQVRIFRVLEALGNCDSGCSSVLWVRYITSV